MLKQKKLFNFFPFVLEIKSIILTNNLFWEKKEMKKKEVIFTESEFSFLICCAVLRSKRKKKGLKERNIGPFFMIAWSSLGALVVKNRLVWIGVK